MLTCREAAAQADILLTEGLGWRQRLSLRLHLMLCHHCRRYLRQARKLLRAIYHLHGPASSDEVRRVMDKLKQGKDEEK